MRGGLVKHRIEWLIEMVQCYILSKGKVRDCYALSGHSLVSYSKGTGESINVMVMSD